MNNYRKIVKATEDPAFAIDLYKSLIGDKIGEGEYRKVYNHATNPNMVVKIQTDLGRSSNVIEWEMWSRLRFAPDNIKRWFCPIEHCSVHGHILIQRKCQTYNVPQPKKLPHFLADVKQSNFGILDGKLVCFDYDFTIYSLMQECMNGKLMIEVTNEDWFYDDKLKELK